MKKSLSSFPNILLIFECSYVVVFFRTYELQIRNGLSEGEYILYMHDRLPIQVYTEYYSLLHCRSRYESKLVHNTITAWFYFLTLTQSFIFWNQCIGFSSVIDFRLFNGRWSKAKILPRTHLHSYWVFKIYSRINISFITLLIIAPKQNWHVNSVNHQSKKTVFIGNNVFTISCEKKCWYMISPMMNTLKQLTQSNRNFSLWQLSHVYWFQLPNCELSVSM